MFGCCVAGRPLETNFQQVDETRIVFELPSASTINHICVFLLGTVPFPDGYGATVHLFWPGKGAKLLGMLSADKPSAIFRLRGTFVPNTTEASVFTSAGAVPTNPVAGDVALVLGLSVEPLDQIQQQLLALAPAHQPTMPGDTMSKEDPAVLVEKIAKHLVNYLSGFSGQGVTPAAMNVIANWYQLIVGKVKTAGVEFLYKGD